MKKISTLLSTYLRAGFCLVLLLSAHTSFGQTVKTIELNYSEKDFEFFTSQKGDMMISPRFGRVTYSNDTLSPALPFFHYYLLVSASQSYQNNSVTSEEKLIASNISLIPNQLPVLLDKDEVPYYDDEKKSYTAIEFPANKIKYTGTHEIGMYKVISFCICPFRYDTNSGNLYLSKKILVDINLKEMKGGFIATASTMEKDGQDDSMDQVVKKMVENPEDMLVYYNQGVHIKSTSIKNISNQDEVVDYLMVTNDALKVAFAPLVNWKKMKGLRSKVVTVEEIYSSYPQVLSNPLKIKKYLNDQWRNHGLKFVMLGGDDAIVPVQHCHMGIHISRNGSSELLEEDVPTDMYYSCFSGSFDWDANENGIIGEYGVDDVNLNQSIILTRLPVRSASDVCSYLSKLIPYEVDPLASNWSNSILTAGAFLYRDKIVDGVTISDAQYFGDLIFGGNYFSWPGDRIRFYDTDTDFPLGKNYQLSKNNLQSQLSSGYGFVDMITHGSYNSWATEYDSYTRNEASSLTNSIPMFISTAACNSNEFDSSDDPCLSESLIRNQDNGVLGYFGCSKQTFFSQSNWIPDGALYFTRNFWSSLLLSSDDHPLHFGSAAMHAKANVVSELDTDTAYVWMKYGFNPIGDPEMPVYVHLPKYFKNIRIQYSNNNLYIEHDKRNFEITVMTYDDNGANSYLHSEANGWSYNISGIEDGVVVCLHADGYVPFIFKYENGTIHFPNARLVGTCNVKGLAVVAGDEIIPYYPKSSVAIEGKTVIQSHQGVEIQSNFEVHLGSEFEILNSH